MMSPASSTSSMYSIGSVTPTPLSASSSSSSLSAITVSSTPITAATSASSSSSSSSSSSLLDLAGTIVRKVASGGGTVSINFSNGDKYDGFIKDQCTLHGRGTYNWADGHWYDGEWLNSTKHGCGTETNTTGDRFEGEWAMGLPHGRGRFAFRGGRIDGVWVDGLLQGTVVTTSTAASSSSSSFSSVQFAETWMDGWRMERHKRMHPLSDHDGGAMATTPPTSPDESRYGSDSSASLESPSPFGRHPSGHHQPITPLSLSGTSPGGPPSSSSSSSSSISNGMFADAHLPGPSKEYPIPPSTPMLQGFMFKQGGQVKTWKRRFFALQDDCLYYMSSDKASQCKTLIYLKHIQSVEVTPATLLWDLCFQIVVKDRVYYIKAASGAELTMWIEAIYQAKCLVDVAALQASVNKELFDAVNSSDVDKVRSLLPAAACADGSNERRASSTALTATPWLIGNFSGSTLLHFACTKGNLTIVSLLVSLNMGRQKVSAGSDGKSSSSSSSSSNIHRKLIEPNCIDVNASDRYGNTPLLCAVQKQHTKVVEYLLDNGADMTAADAMKRTVLHEAAAVGSAELCRLLVGRGADVNRVDKRGTTPLMVAVINQRIDTVAALLAGANVLLHLKDMDGCNVIHRAAILPDNGAVMSLLIDKIATMPLSVTVPSSSSKTPSMLQGVPQQQQQSIATQDLLNLATDVRCLTPLMIAAMRGHKDTVKLLVDHGAQLNVQDSLGNTALHYACRKELKDIVLLLVGAGALLNLRNREDKTPVEVSESSAGGMSTPMNNNNSNNSNNNGGIGGGIGGNASMYNSGGIVSGRTSSSSGGVLHGSTPFF